MDTELKPCPFCGAEPLLQEHPAHAHNLQIGDWKMPDHPGSWTIECCACNCGMINQSREQVTADWNRRADIPTDQPSELYVWRATTKFGTQCHFGEASAAKAWAGKEGTIERVELKPVPELQLVEQPSPAKVPPIPEQWSKSLTHCWPDDADDRDGDWCVGVIDEEGNFYEVVKVEASQYDAAGESQKIAEAIVALWEFARLNGKEVGRG